MESIKKPLLVSHTTESQTDDFLPPPPDPEPYSQTRHESTAEMLVRLRNYPPTSMLRPLKRVLIPRLSSVQLLEFFNRPPGPRCTDAYHIRLAQFGDVPEMAMLQARVDWNMPAMHVFNPRKEAFPQRYLKAYWESNLMWMTKPGSLTYVAVRKHQACCVNEAQEEEVIGAIRFSRQGEGKKGATRQHGWVGWIVDWCMRLWAPVRQRVFPLNSKKMWSEAEKGAAADAIERFTEAEKKHWERGDLKERWYVGTVCVKDEWQGRGVGRALMGEAVAKCIEDRLPLTLSATESGRHLYHKMGFECLDILRLPGFEKNSRYEIMVWDPKKRD